MKKNVKYPGNLFFFCGFVVDGSHVCLALLQL
jgi:hypothetical protein